MQVTLPDISERINGKHLYYLCVKFLNVNIREDAININVRENAININIRNFYTAFIRFVPLRKVKHRGRIREVMHEKKEARSCAKRKAGREVEQGLTVDIEGMRTGTGT